MQKQYFYLIKNASIFVAFNILILFKSSLYYATTKSILRLYLVLTYNFDVFKYLSLY